MNNDYISGFFDADGYITISKKNQNEEARVIVGFTNTVRPILEDIRKYFKAHGIKGYICKKKAKKENHKDSYDLKFSGTGRAELIFNHLSIRHPKKVKRFKMAKRIMSATIRNGKYTTAQLNKRRLFCQKFLRIGE